MPSAQVLQALRERIAFHKRHQPTRLAIRKVYLIAAQPPPVFNRFMAVSHLFPVPHEYTVKGNRSDVAGQARFCDVIGHAKAPLAALVSYCHFAIVYRRSPVGLPAAAVLGKAKNSDETEKPNRLMQELAWEAVTQHPLSRVKEKGK
jgi:hypothetical protein